MSRSYRKYPCISIYYGKSGKFGRRQANKKIRSLPIDYELPKGRGFKKLYNSYDICDYQFTQFKEWAIKDWEKECKDLANGVNMYKNKYHQTLQEELNNWKKDYLCK